MRYLKITLGIFITFILNSCVKDKIIIPVIDDGGININELPYASLSEYDFFIGEIKLQNPTAGVFNYQPASSLFTDYAKKKRFVWMPEGSKANFVSDHELLDFPVGTILVKTFYYDHVIPSDETRIIETRLMIHKSSGWEFAEYVWNEDQTDAFLDMDGSYQEISWIQETETKTSNYRIPSETECLICHKKSGEPIPIGLKPQNLNFDLQSGQNQLLELIQIGYLTDNLPSEINAVIDYNDPNENLDMRLRSYLDINCAHCHSENAHCDYRPMRLAFSETNNPVNMGLCVEPDEIIDAALINILTPGNINRSMMHFRLSSTDENTRMPLLGRTLVHEEGVQLLEEWINSKTDCN